MVRQQIVLGEEAQDILDTLVEMFNSTRSKTVEALILDHVDDYVNSRKQDFDEWVLALEEESDEESEDEDLDEESEESEEFEE